MNECIYWCIYDINLEGNAFITHSLSTIFLEKSIISIGMMNKLCMAVALADTDQVTKNANTKGTKVKLQILRDFPFSSLMFLCNGVRHKKGTPFLFSHLSTLMHQLIQRRMHPHICMNSAPIYSNTLLKMT